MRATAIFWLFSLLLLPMVLVSSFSKPWGIRADVWETAAAIRAISENPLHPANPLLRLPGDTSPRFTPYTIGWGLVARFTRLDLFTVVGFAGLVNYLLFITGLRRFLIYQFRRRDLPLIALVTMLTVWGTGYGQANGYQLRMFLAGLPLVGFFVYGICFHALAELRRYTDSNSRSSLAFYVLLSILAFLTHPITALFGFTAALALVLTTGNLRQIVLLQLVPITAFCVSLLWPYFDYWTVLTKGSSESWFEAPLFANQFTAMGTALLGIPIAIAYAIQRKYLFIFYGLIFCAAVYGISAAMTILIGSRFLLYGAIFLHLAIAVYIIEDWPDWWRNMRRSAPRTWIKFAILIVLLLPPLRWRLPEVRNEVVRAAQIIAGKPVSTLYSRIEFLRDHIDSNATIMAEEDTDWSVPSITGARIVSQQKGNPLISDEIQERRETVRRFFFEQHTAPERRSLLSKYRATHILLDLKRHNQWSPDLLPQLPLLAEKRAEQDSLALYEIVWF